MPMRWLAWAAVLTGLATGAALAQTPAPASDDEAMERARRQAENPLRRIMEASRITVRRRATSDAGEAGEAGQARAAADADRRGTASPATVSTTEGAAGTVPPPTGEAPAIRVTVEPILPPPARSPAAAGPALALPPGVLPGATTAAGSPEPATAPPATVPPSGPGGTPATTVAPAPPSPAVESGPSTPAPAALAPERQPPDPPADVPAEAPPEITALPAAERSLPAVAEPELRGLVEPALSSRMRDELGRTGEVTVDLQIGADGRVQDVVFVTRVPVGVRRVVTTALLQWQYAPLTQPTLHRVELVFER